MFKDKEHFNFDFYDKSFNNEDFSLSEFTNCDFHSCDFARADFFGAILIGCDFFRCTFPRAFLTGVRFEHCSFYKCEFDETYIFRSQFKYCGILESSMSGAMLSTVDFTGTDFKDVRWNGTIINSPPLIVDGIEYPVVALDNGHMHVGCEFNTMDWFWNTDEKHSAAMEGLRARRFWKHNKKWIFDMLVARGLYVYPEN